MMIQECDVQFFQIVSLDLMVGLRKNCVAVVLTSTLLLGYRRIWLSLSCSMLFSSRTFKNFFSNMATPFKFFFSPEEYEQLGLITWRICTRITVWIIISNYYGIACTSELVDAFKFSVCQNIMFLSLKPSCLIETSWWLEQRRCQSSCRDSQYLCCRYLVQPICMYTCWIMCMSTSTLMKLLCRCVAIEFYGICNRYRASQDLNIANLQGKPAVTANLVWRSNHKRLLTCSW